MSANPISQWLLEDIDLASLENQITPLAETDTDYINYNVSYFDYANSYYDYYNYSVYYDYYNYSAYYNYYNYYNYNNSISVTLNPVSQSVIVNGTVTFSVGASNTIDSCQWYIADTATGAGRVIEGATLPTYSFTATLASDNKYYYCIVRRGGNSATSSRALLTVRSLTVYNLYTTVEGNVSMFFVRANPPTTQISSVVVENSAIATVTNTGEVTGVSVGTTNCTVTGTNGVSATFKITVLSKEETYVAMFMNTAIAIREYRGTSLSLYPNQMANALRGSYDSIPYDTIEELFTDISDAIRELSGSTDLIPSVDYYTRILALVR